MRGTLLYPQSNSKVPLMQCALGAMAAALRVLRGAARLAAVPGAAAVLIMLTFCTWALAIPAAVIILITARKPQTRLHHRAASAGTGLIPAACTAQPELAAAR